MSDVSDVSWGSPFFKRIILFQSLTQFASWTFVVALFYLSIFLASRIVGWRLLEDFRIFIIPVFFSLYSVYSALPCTFAVSKSQSTNLVAMMETRLDRLGYAIEKSSKSETTFRSKLPKWMSWKENRVRVCQAGNVFEITAPRIVAKRLRDFLAMAID